MREKLDAIERTSKLSVYNMSERHINNNWRNWLQDDERQSKKLSSVTARRMSTTTGRRGKSSGDKKRQASVAKRGQKILRIMKRNGIVPPNLALLDAKRQKQTFHLFTGESYEGHGHIVCDIKKNRVAYLRNPVPKAV